MFTGVFMISINVRVPEGMIKSIDKWVDEGRFASRSDAVKMIIAFYEEKEKTLSFLSMLDERSREAEENPDILIPIKL
jgi:Arc/MetJ-type ribon-helix-helix transcriptional regulator